MSQTKSFDLRICRVLPPDQDPWLDRCFIPPALFPALLDSRSTVVYASPGHGRTTLTIMGQAQLSEAWLHATYQPWQDGQALTNLFTTIAQQMWQFVQAHPQTLVNLGARATAFRYFLDRAIGRELVTYQLQCLLDDHPDYEVPIQHMLDIQPVELFTSSANDWQRLNVLSDCALKLGLQGVMVWIDLPEHNAVGIGVAARALFDSLDLMRQRHIHFKCLAPLELQPYLSNARSVVTGSVEQLHLAWQVDDLVDLAQRRLRAASLNSSETPLRSKDMVPLESFTQFLEQFSDPTSPSEWVALTGYCLEQAVATQQLPLTSLGWLASRRRYCADRLKIHLDAQGTFWRGPHPLKDLTPRKRALYPLVKYLYEHPGYHLPYKLAKDLNTDVDTLNTYIHRIRKEYLEPLLEEGAEEENLYLVTDTRGEGYALLHTDYKA